MMKAILRIIFTWLFKITIKNSTAIGGPARVIFFTNRGNFWQVLVLHLCMPGEYVFVVPEKLTRKLGLLTGGRQRLSYNPQEHTVIRKIAFCLKEGKTVVLFPAPNIDLADLCRAVDVIMRMTKNSACPVAVNCTKQNTVFLPLAEFVVAVGDTLHYVQNGLHDFRQTGSHAIYEVMQKTIFETKYYGQASLFDELLVAAGRYGMSKTAAKDITGKITYRELIVGSYILGEKLEVLCRGQSRVGLLLPTSIGHLVAFFALCYKGKTPAILNFSSGSRTVRECAELVGLHTIITARVFIEKAGLQQLIADLEANYNIVYLEDIKAGISLTDKLSGFIKLLEHRQAPRANDHRIILFTSGSEQRPKGVILKHANIIANVEQLDCVVEFNSADRMFSALPMFHSFGLTGGVMLTVLKGMEVYLYPSPLHFKIIPEIIASERSTILLGTPTFLAGYAKGADEQAFQSLRYVFAGGEKLNSETRQQWLDQFGIHLMEAYGTTEAAPGVCISSHHFNKDGTVGKFLPGIERRIEKVSGIYEGGKLWIKGPNIMEGYLLHGTGFQPTEQWYDCGDVVEIDQEGYCSIKARLKRFAKISGEMISLSLVEAVAEQALNWRDNAAVSVLDAKKGEKIVLFTTKTGASIQQLREYLRQEQHTMLLLPDDVLIVEELPVLGSGKVDYVSLQELARG